MVPAQPPTADSQRAWYCASAGVRMGPFTRDEVERLWAEAGISTESLVWTVGMPAWLPAHEVFGAEEAELPVASIAAPGDAGAASADQAAAARSAPLLRYHRPAADVGVKPAGFWMRLVAWLIDTVILSGVNQCVIAPAFVALLGASGGLVPRVAASQPAVGGAGGGGLTWVFNVWMGSTLWWLTLLQWAVVLSYFVLLEASPWQATIGKRALGLRVGDANGRRLPAVRTLIRQLAKWINTLTLNLSYLTIAFTARKSGIHDLMTGTTVSYRPKNGLE